MQAAEDAVIAQKHAELAEKSDEDILEELGLPDPDCLVMGDDFKTFMSKAVPAHLRKRALRTLWRSNPVLACVDGLNDYDDDYLTGSYGQEPIKTAYQVGKGMLAHLLAVEQQKEALLEVDDEAETEDDFAQVEDDFEQLEDAGLDDAVGDDEAMPQAEPEADEPVMIASATPRRMQFHFEDDAA